MYADLVCKGGGVKGTALVGAISYLEEQGYTWKRLAGTSVGAIVTSLLAVGYTSKEITDILFDLDYKSLIDKRWLNLIPVLGPLINLLMKKGIHSGNPIEKILNEKFAAKNKTTFRDISLNGESYLKIIASDTTNKRLLVLPDDLIHYNINPLDFEIAKAVRMSMSVPFYFKPIKLYHNNSPALIVDGGLLSNFPIWLFDSNDEPKWPTFGLNLYDDYNTETSKHIKFTSFLLDIAQTSLMTNEDTYFKDSDSIRIMNIPTLGINSLDFSLSYEQKLSLYNSGYSVAKSFLSNWDFENYLRMCRR